MRTFAEALAAWDRQIDRAVGVGTADRYRCSRAQIAPWLEGRTLPEINGRLVAEIIEGRQAAGVKSATIKRDLGALSSVLKFCILKDWCEDNPVLAELALIPERRDPIVLPLERDIKLVAEHIGKTAPAVANLIWAACKTGARETELIRAARLKCKWLFWNRDGEPYSLSSFAGNLSATVKDVAAWAKREGVEFTPFTFHHLRHWHAVH